MLQFTTILRTIQLTVCLLAADSLPAQSVLATIDKETITESDLRLHAAIMKVALSSDPADDAEVRRQLLDQLIDRRLVRRFLKSRKISADPQLLAASVSHLRQLIQSQKDDPDALLKRLGVTPEVLEDHLGLPLAWDAYVRLTVTNQRLTDHFQQHRAEIDGTKLRAAQILLKLPSEVTAADIDARKEQLAKIRKEIVDQKLAFADAAKKYSEAPSKSQGGDVGWFPYQGKMPLAFSQAAFQLKTGDISEPVVSPFGVHLIHVTARQPGELSFDDVRKEIIERISQELWRQTADGERKKTKVDVK